MELLVIGGDARFAHLTDMAVSRGIHAAALGEPADGGRVIEAVGRAKALLMPNPWRGPYRLPHSGCPHSMEEVMEALPKASAALLFGSDDMPLKFQVECGQRVADLLQDEPFVQRNAVLTAEGAVFSAMNGSDRALCESAALIIGYGRIGRALGRMLMGLHATVTVCARRAEVREEALRDGMRAAEPRELPAILGNMNFIFSTPPVRILDEDALRAIKRSARLIDLSSPPYGFDLDIAGRLRLHATREAGLPGRYCPQSAAEALLDAVIRHIR